ncbi:unnamed protein product [Dicrocoelium dendriticum]|nr:unnamed protein product [Dicrocoelium dendriticum]
MLWSGGAEKLSLQSWIQWKTSFQHQMTLFPVLNPSIVLSDTHWITLFRQALGSEGQRHFDAMNLMAKTTIVHVIQLFEELWGIQQSVFSARYQFFKLQQRCGEGVNDFIARIHQATPECRYNTIPSSRFEEVMKIQCLIGGVTDDGAREKLLSQEEETLSWEMACNLVRQRENLKSQLSTFDPPQPVECVNKLSPRLSFENRVRKFVCYRCGDQHTSSTQCPHTRTKCINCGKLGHLARVCRSPRSQVSIKSSNSDDDECPDSQLNFMNHIISNCSVMTKVSPYRIKLHVNNEPVLFELDAGSAVTLISKNALSSLPDLEPTDTVFRTYTGEVIDLLGKCQVRVQHQGRSHSLVLHVVPQAPVNLLGRDWMKMLPQVLNTIHSVGEDTFESVFKRYPEVFDEQQLGRLNNFKAKVHMSDSSKPKFFKARTLPYSLRSRVEDELKRLQREGIIVPVQQAEWAAPIVPVLKPDGNVRNCGDYKLTVNRGAIIDRYRLPKTEDLYANLSGGVKFTKLDLSHAYSQVELDETSRRLTTISTHLGLFEYTRLPFGINSAPAIFQRIIDNIVLDIPNTCAYLDDILITGRTKKEHLYTLDRVSHKLSEHYLRLKRSKCVFLVDSVDYLGYRLDKHGLHARKDKLQPIISAPSPRNGVQLRSFVRMLSHHRRFPPNLASVLAPIHKLLKKDSKWAWDEEEQQALDRAKGLLDSSPVLVHYDPNKTLILQCAASPFGVGAVLGHKVHDGAVRPIAFASRTLQSAEKNYAQLDKEALAVVFGVKRFHQYLWGNQFEIQTDHKPLLSLLGKERGIEQLNAPRMVRWALLLSAYNYRIRYIAGPHNNVADALSRLPQIDQQEERSDAPYEFVQLLQPLNTTPISGDMVRKATDRDPVLSTVKRMLLRGWGSRAPGDLRPFFNCRFELSLHEGCILRGSRIVIPLTLRSAVLKEFHDAHPSIVRMKALARSYCWWPAIDRDIEALLSTCNTCQKYQRDNPTGPIHPWQLPDSPWERVHADYFGPIGRNMLLLLVMAYSKWIDVHVFAKATVKATINNVRSLLSTHSIPKTLVTDNGPQFTSATFKEYLQSNGVHHMTSAPYHPTSNGLAERAVQTVKAGLLRQRNGSLRTKLDRFLFAYRITLLESIGKSPGEAMFGRRLRTRLDLLFPDPRQTRRCQQQRMHESERAPVKPQKSIVERDVYTKLPHEQLWQPDTVLTSPETEA